MKALSSRLIHGGKNKDSFRSLKTPVHVTSAFDFENSQAMADAFQGVTSSHAYSRITNPTVSELQNRLCDMADAEAALCLSSGMAAITAVLTALLSTGDRVLTAPWLFGNTLSLLKNTLPNFGVEADFVDLRNLEAVEKAVRAETRVLLVETLSNPQLILADMKGLSEICRRHQIILMVDNSLLTPYLFRAADFDVDVEVFSTTKFVSGGGTGIGGAILFYHSSKWAEIPALKGSWDKAGPMALYDRIFFEVYRNQGGCMSPQTAWLQLLGLETLALRADRAQQNALAAAEFLAKKDAVSRVIFPGLEDFSRKELLNSILNGNTGQMILFDLENQEQCFRFMDRLKMIRRATNFCDNKSLILHPASTIYHSSTEKELQEMGFSSASLRFSTGIEDIGDILDDLDQALEDL